MESFYVNSNDETKTRTISNFTMQGNGSEMLRCAMVLAHREALQVVAPIHDALLVECDAEDAATAKETLERVMQVASGSRTAGGL